MNKYIKNNIQMLCYIHEASKFRIFLSAINAVLQSILPVWNIIIIQKSISLLTSDNEKAFYELLMFIFLSAVIYAVVTLYGAWFRQIYSVHSDLRIRKSIQEKVYAKIRNIDIAAFDNPQFYSVYTRAVKETSSRAISVLSSIINLFGSILTFLGVISILVWLDYIIIVFVLISVIISVLINGIQNTVSYQYDKEQTSNNREQDYISRLFYLSQYAKEIKLYDLYNYFIDKFRVSINKEDGVRKKYDKKFVIFDILQNMQVFLVLGIIVYLGWRFMIGAIVIADFATLLNASQEFGNSIQQLFMVIPQIAQNSFYIDNINEFLNYKSVVENNKDGVMLNSSTHNIEINKLGFKYSEKTPYILSDINLNIESGEKIAIVGPNGSGKTTLVKNIIRLYDPTTGSISMDNKEYRAYDVYSLRKRIGVVF